MVEDWVPNEEQQIISARVTKELADFVDALAMELGCNRTEAICRALKYARACDEIYRMIRIYREDGRVPSGLMQMAMEQLASLSMPFFDQRKRMAKEKERLEQSVEDRLHPAMFDRAMRGGAKNMIGEVAAFQPTDNGQPDKIANRTTAQNGFRLGGNSKKTPTLDVQEDSAEYKSSTAPAVKMTTEIPREERARKLAKRRDDDTVMSATGWA
jgi:hypothetical protein